MRTLILSIFFGCISSAQAQTEFYIPHSDTTIDSYNLSHLTDDAGNVYLLGQSNEYYSGPNYLTEGPLMLGSLICKVSTSGAVLWQRIYPTVADSLYYQSAQFPNLRTPYLPATQLFVDGSNIFVPFGIYTGINRWTFRRNALLELDGNTGDIIGNRILADSCCSTYDLRASQYASGQLSNFYSTTSDTGHHLMYEERNPPYQTREFFKLVDTMWNPTLMHLIQFDKHRDEYVMFDDKSQIVVYDRSIEQKRLLSFYDSTLYKYVHPISMAINSEYYVINYSAITKAGSVGDYFLCIMDKQGNIVSSAAAQHYRSMEMATDHTLWAIPYQSWDRLKMNNPVTVLQLDILQNLKRKISIGKPYVDATKISVLNRAEIIVSGTLATSSADLYPNKKPSQLYVYRRPVHTIPQIIRSKECVDYSIGPNPTAKWLQVTNLKENEVKVYDLSIINSVGQYVLRQSFTTHAEVDMEGYGKGLYIIRLADVNSQNSCFAKFILN